MRLQARKILSYKLSKILKYVLTVMIFLTLSSSSFAYKKEEKLSDLRKILEQIITPYKATVGIAVMDIENNNALTINGEHQYPMQSMYKLPLAIAVLHQVDEGKLLLDQKIHITKKDLRPNTWSPLGENFPKGNIDITISELLKYTVSASDNNACDVLFRLVGGPKKVEQYIHGLGIKEISIATTEAEMAKAWEIQYKNWAKPSAIAKLLEEFYHKKYLSESSGNFLMQLMIESSTGPKRIRGLLPTEIVVAHKTGTSSTNKKGIRAATNDVGIITLPNGKHIAIAVFVSDSTEQLEINENIIAQISKATYDYFATQKTPATQSINLFDSIRNRGIPVEIYSNTSTDINNHQIVIINGGYGSKNTEYTFIANKLTGLGYLVLSIQHDLPTDMPLAREGNLYELRKPVWERGVENILFVISELKRKYPDRNFNKLNLIGHSNGGDISMLLATKFPGLVSKAITLDHRRMPIPRVDSPKILSVRATDFEADDNVLPNVEEQKKFGIEIYKLSNNAKHGDLCDDGSKNLKEEIIKQIEKILG